MKKRRLFALVGAVHCLTGALSHAAEESLAEEAQVAAEVARLFELSTKAEQVESEELGRVTNVVLYDVKVKLRGPDGSSTSTVRVTKSDRGVGILERPSTNQPCPWLKEMIGKDFRLRTEEDARELEAALDVLYPVSDHFGGRDLKAKEVRRADGRVVFVRGEFFKNLKGFIFEIDDKGSITKVSYSLKLEKE